MPNACILLEMLILPSSDFMSIPINKVSLKRTQTCEISAFSPPKTRRTAWVSSWPLHTNQILRNADHCELNKQFTDKVRMSDFRVSSPIVVSSPMYDRRLSPCGFPKEKTLSIHVEAAVSEENGLITAPNTPESFYSFTSIDA